MSTLTFRRITFGYVAFMASLGGMAVLVALTKFGVVGHDFGLYFTIVATILTGIGCGGEFEQNSYVSRQCQVLERTHSIAFITRMKMKVFIILKF